MPHDADPLVLALLCLVLLNQEDGRLLRLFWATSVIYFAAQPFWVLFT